MTFFIWTGLVALLSAGPESTNYFPPAFAQPSVSCDFGRPNRPIPIVSDLENRWYSSHLGAAKEPSLFLLSKQKTGSGSRPVRFTWLRSFDPTVIVRIENLGAPRPVLVAKQLSGAGGYGPGSISKSIRRPLSTEEAGRVKAALAKTNIMEMSPKVCELGADGSQWIVEGVDAHGYHSVDRWSPESGSLHEFGLMMLRLTGWKLDPIY